MNTRISLQSNGFMGMVMGIVHRMALMAEKIFNHSQEDAMLSNDLMIMEQMMNNSFNGHMRWIPVTIRAVERR